MSDNYGIESELRHQDNQRIVEQTPKEGRGAWLTQQSKTVNMRLVIYTLIALLVIAIVV